MNRNYFNHHVWKPALRAAGVEPARANGMHALRHFYASVQLEAGTSVRALAEYLGHADPGFTLRVYTHLMPSSESRARQAVDEAFAGRAEGRGATRLTKRPPERIARSTACLNGGSGTVAARTATCSTR